MRVEPGADQLQLWGALLVLGAFSALPKQPKQVAGTESAHPEQQDRQPPRSKQKAQN
jgi:hypothetical protein